MGSRLQKNSEAVRKRIEGHTFENEEGDEYEGSKFGGFGDYFRRKKIKLQNRDVELRSSSTGTPQIFKGIVTHVNGYTQPSLIDLHQMIVSHGGGFMQYLDGKTTVTHIIAANITAKKAVEFKNYRIVKPAWIVDSIEAGKVLPWDNYRVVDEGAGQRLLVFNDGKIASEAPAQSRTYRDQMRTSWYAGQVRKYAEGINNGDDSRFSIAKRATVHASSTYLSKKSPTEGDGLQSKVGHIEPGGLEPDQSNPDSFGVSSSLEDALNAADDSPTPEQYDEETVPPPGEAADGFIEEGVDDISHFKSRASGSPSEANYDQHIDASSPTKKARVMTAEGHNAILLADPNIRKSSTANPDFLKQFYSESRLHHLSTWKADLKTKLLQMAADMSLSQKQAQKQARKRKPGSRRYIMHVDFDSFFCAVSLKSAPDYVERPAVVAHGSGLGSEIASCNYPARAFGVKNGMWMKKALDLCPDIKVLPYDFPAYEEASRLFYMAILDVGGIVQSVSVDEALVDISSLCLVAGGGDGHDVSEESIWREQEEADEIAQNLRQHIYERTSCNVSVGIGGNVLLAKVALRRAKPAGQYQIKPEEVLDFVGDLLVRDLPGVAYSIGGKLEEIGVKFVKDVRSLSKDRLMTVLGPKTGQKIWDYSRGIDPTEIGEQAIRKSVSAEVNWGIRFINQPEAEEFVQNLCGELQKRLIDSGVKGRHLTIKIMRRAADAPLDPPKHLGHGKCDTFNKSVILGVATNSSEIIGREAVSILRSYGFSPGELRGLGVQMTKLEPLKAPIDGRPDDSQRRITFNTMGPKLLRKTAEDPITDPDSSQKPKTTPVHPAIVITRANAADLSAKKPLNLLGTQFILPTQIDPRVLAQLPQDIRAKLLAQSKSAPASRTPSRAQSPTAIESSPLSPSPPPPSSSLPSQLDPEFLAALPSEMQAEICGAHTFVSRAGAQSLLPQSPRKNRTLHQPYKRASITTPTKKRAGRGRLLFRGHGRDAKTDNATLTQPDFLAGKRASKDVDVDLDVNENGSDADYAEDFLTDDEGLDQDFLAVLPSRVRAEIDSEDDLDLSPRSAADQALQSIERSEVPQLHIHFPPRPTKPTFTTAQLSSLPELRTALREWHEEFREEGPQGDDVSALERYLRRVVIEGRDLGKVVGLLRWLEWVVEAVGDGGSLGGKEKEEGGRNAWRVALRGLKEGVQEAVRERGLGRLEL